jgi:uncharacterized membrane protein
MNAMDRSLAPLRSLALAIIGVLIAVVAVGVGRRSGVLEPELAKRLGVVVFGIMLAVVGNYMPKFVVPSSTPATAAARRFAGRVFVLAGLAYVLVCLLAPMPQAVIVPSVIGIGAFVAAGVHWIRAVGPGVRRTEDEKAAAGHAPRAFEVERAAPYILLGLFFVFVIFLSDALWGDAVARWMAVGYCFASAMAALIVSMRRVLRS